MLKGQSTAAIGSGQGQRRHLHGARAWQDAQPLSFEVEALQKPQSAAQTQVLWQWAQERQGQASFEELQFIFLGAHGQEDAQVRIQEALEQ